MLRHLALLTVRSVHASARLLVVAVVVVAALSAVFSPVHAVGSSAFTAPSRSQLSRLYHLEPYIRYFSALTYGHEDAVVSEDYIRALILSESAGDKWAHSVKGARGLTQIMPSTGRAAAAHLVSTGFDFRYVDERKLAGFSPDLLYDPALNLLIACYVNATYHRMYDGREDLMAAAWNAGPAAVQRSGNKPPSIPETRAFVGRVLTYMQYFEKRGDQIVF